MISLETQLSGTFKALAHPTRIGILQILREADELCVCHIYERLDLEQSNISQHLKILRDQGILETRREGSMIMYRAKDPRYYVLLDTVKQILITQMEQTLIGWKENGE